MSVQDHNAVWAQAFAEELARAGVSDVCIAPGSRSAPLVLACARLGAFRMRVHLDERAAGYFALGLGKATGIPAAVVTTSGTAAANLFPAVVEASLSESPLLVLTADRPHRLRGADANQTIEQVRLYGVYTREFFDVPMPAAEGPALRHLRTIAGRAVASAVGLPAGPVHLNFPFDLPLEPTGRDHGDGQDALAVAHPLAVRGRTVAGPYVSVGRRRPILGEGEIGALRTRLAASRRPLLVAGPSVDATALGAAATRFAEALEVPVLADPLSGARYGHRRGGHACAGYDLFLREPAVRSALVPDLVLRVGRTPTSAALIEYLENVSLDAQVVIDPSYRWKDHLATAAHVFRGDAADALGRLAERRQRAERDPAWRTLWIRLEHAVGAALEEPLARTGASTRFEGMVARHVVRAIPADGTLFVSGSMPIRDVDAFGGTRTDPLRVVGNRGASGIDGIMSTALGVAAGIGATVVALLGDLALLHDTNGLLAAREPDARVVFVVVNNDGGGIFHFLPIREHEPHFTPLFATPHGIEPERVAALHGLPWQRVDPENLSEQVERAVLEGRSRILEVKTDREINRQRREQAVSRARAAARDAVETH